MGFTFKMIHYNALSFLMTSSGSASGTSPLAAKPATLNELWFIMEANLVKA